MALTPPFSYVLSVSCLHFYLSSVSDEFKSVQILAY